MFTRTAFLLLLGLLGQSGATNVALNPVRLNITTPEKATALTVTNNDHLPVQFKVQVFHWVQRDGQDVLEPTQNVLINPPRITVAPGATQLVRVALRVPSRVPQDAYRVILSEEAPPDAPASAPVSSATASSAAPTDATTKAKITTLFRFSLPLFVGVSSATPQVSTTLIRTASGVQVALKNTGTGFAAYRNMIYKVGQTEGQLGSVYVLPNSTMTLNVPDSTGLQGVFTLSYQGLDGVNQSETLNLPTP